MTTKKKLAISITTLCLVLLLCIAIPVGIWAAQNATIKNPINVTYTAKEIGAEVSATYQRKTDASPTSFVTSTGEATITLTGEEDDNYEASFAAVDADKMELSKTNDTITFVYSFKNTGDKSFTVTLGGERTAENVTVKYTAGTAAESDSASVLTVAAGATGTYTIVVAIDSYAKDASFSGSFEWALAAVVE